MNYGSDGLIIVVPGHCAHLLLSKHEHHACHVLFIRNQILNKRHKFISYAKRMINILQLEWYAYDLDSHS